MPEIQPAEGDTLLRVDGESPKSRTPRLSAANPKEVSDWLSVCSHLMSQGPGSIWRSPSDACCAAAKKPSCCKPEQHVDVAAANHVHLLHLRLICLDALLQWCEAAPAACAQADW